MTFPILSLMLAVPVIAALWVLFAPGDEPARANMARYVALGATLIDFVLGIALWAGYDIGGAQWQYVENAPVFGRFSWALGIDGIALMLVMLSVFLMPICILASWRSIEKRVPEYMAAFLLMETLMLGVFMAQDLFLFYIFFEAGLIPMYLIIGVWGGAERIYASYKFFLYTLFGSVLMLVAMLWMAREAGTTYVPALMAHDFPPEAQSVAVPGVPRVVRGEAADVAGAHLAARRARAGADRGFGDPGGRAAEARRLWLRALFAADVSGGRRTSSSGWCAGSRWWRWSTRRSSRWCSTT